MPLIIIYSILVALGLVLALVVILFSTAFFMSKKKKWSDSNIRIYTYDYARKTFQCFDRNNLTNRKDMTEEDFYSQFEKRDQYELSNWFYSIICGKSERPFMQADVRINSKSRSIPSILEFTGISRERNLIHFESHLLTFISSYSSFSRRRKARYMLSSPDDAREFLSDSDSNALTSAFMISFYGRDNSKVEISAKECLDVISSYFCKTRRILAVTEKDFLLIDNTTMSKAMAMQLATSLETRIRQHLNMRDSDTMFAIGLSTGSYYQKDFDKAKEQCMMMTKAIVEGASPTRVLFYDQDYFEREKKKKKDLEEVTSLIRNKTFRVYFSPSLDIEDFKQSIYAVSIKPFGTEAKEFSGVLRVSSEIDNGTKNLFLDIKEVLNSRANTLEERATVMLEVIYSSLDSFMKAFGRNDSNLYSTLICLQESDLVPYLSNQKVMLDKFNDLRRRGYKLAIRITNVTSLIPNKLLDKFSYVVIGNEFTSDLEDSQAQSNLSIIQKDYLKSSRKLIFTQLADDNQIELCAHHGGTIFQSVSLGGPSSLFETIDAEKIEELKERLK